MTFRTPRRKQNFCISVQGDTFEQYFWTFLFMNKNLVYLSIIEKKKVNIVKWNSEDIQKIKWKGLLGHPILARFPIVKDKNVIFKTTNEVNKNFDIFNGSTFIIRVKINQAKRNSAVAFFIFPTFFISVK